MDKLSWALELAFCSLSLSSEESLFYFIFCFSVDFGLWEGQMQAVQGRTKPKILNGEMQVTKTMDSSSVFDFREGQRKRARL